MNWELYEVWTVDTDGHEELVETTKSLKQAKQIADLNIQDDENITECVIYQENEDGELVEVETIYAG